MSRVPVQGVARTTSELLLFQVTSSASMAREAQEHQRSPCSLAVRRSGSQRLQVPQGMTHLVWELGTQEGWPCPNRCS